MKDPLALLDELERVLGIGAFPVNWPIGNGFEFQGVYRPADEDRCICSSAPSAANIARRLRSAALHDPVVRGRLDDADFRQDASRNWKCSKAPAKTFDEAAVLAGKTTPVFFGSGVNNFGVQLLLDGFLKHSPAAQIARDGRHRDRAGKSGVLRFHFQDPGEHGPEASRPHRVRPRLLRQI